MSSTGVGFVAVVVAAGSGIRLGQDRPKALVEVAGRPLVAHAVEALTRAGAEQIVVAHPVGHAEDFVTACGPDTQLVLGGATRSESVGLALEVLSAPDEAIVAIHDAARAFVSAEVISAAVAEVAAGTAAAAPGVPVADTLKRTSPADDGHHAEVLETVDRDQLWAAQTPQVFRLATLRAVRSWADAEGVLDATDDLGLFEDALSAGVVQGRPMLVPSSLAGMKVTHRADLAVAELFASGGRS